MATGVLSPSTSSASDSYCKAPYFGCSPFILAVLNRDDNRGVLYSLLRTASIKGGTSQPLTPRSFGSSLKTEAHGHRRDDDCNWLRNAGCRV